LQYFKNPYHSPVAGAAHFHIDQHFEQGLADEAGIVADSR
jgi:hypothetical protein